MLIDSNTVSINGTALGSSAVTGDAVPLNLFKKPGRQNPICVYVGKAGDAAFAGGTSVAIKIQEGDTETGSFTDVGGVTTVPLAAMNKGGNFGPRFLPAQVSKPWVKIVVTPSGTFTAGKVFAAVVREDDLPYEEGMYIDGGVVKG